LEQENARLAKTNQDLSQNVKTQADENRAGIASLTSRLSQLEGENARLTRTNQELTKNQEKATASIDEITAWIAELEAENVKLNYANRELSQKAEKTKNIVDEKQLTSMLQSAHKEGIVNASAILKDALAIKDPGERKRYLENLKPRYSDATGITAFIDLLISRL
jgi:chromosome segregation ATPase